MQNEFTQPLLLNSQASLVLQEILDEVVRELHKVKDEIINGKQCRACKVHCSIRGSKACLIFDLFYTLVFTTYWQ